MAREIGLGFSVPRDCEVLRWERRGDWSVYPEDHIGRTKGEARAIAAHPAEWEQFRTGDEKARGTVGEFIRHRR